MFINKPALVLLSGGQDSTTVLFEVLRKSPGQRVIALSVDYGQRHWNEILAAQMVTEVGRMRSGNDRVLHHLIYVGNVLHGALLAGGGDVNEPHAVDPSLPASFVPGRNLLFLTIAAQFAYRLGIKDVFCGVCEADSAGYPDCRESFISSVENTINFALGTEGEDQRITVHAPLIHNTKAQIWQRADDGGFLDVVSFLTRTDYTDNHKFNPFWGFGDPETNEASRLRKKGYDEWEGAPDYLPFPEEAERILQSDPRFSQRTLYRESLLEVAAAYR